MEMDLGGGKKSGGGGGGGGLKKVIRSKTFRYPERAGELSDGLPRLRAKSSTREWRPRDGLVSRLRFLDAELQERARIRCGGEAAGSLCRYSSVQFKKGGNRKKKCSPADLLKGNIRTGRSPNGEL